MTKLEKKTVINEIVTEIHDWDDTIITRVADNMIKYQWYPQLYIARVDRHTKKPIDGIWVRIGDLNRDCNEEERWKCLGRDSELEDAGYKVCTVTSYEEAIYNIADALSDTMPEPQDKKENSGRVSWEELMKTVDELTKEKEEYHNPFDSLPPGELHYY